MKNFLELLASSQRLTVTVDGSDSQVPLGRSLEFNVGSTVLVDGVEILPRYDYLAVNGVLTIPAPFYQWYHQVSGQGWLLMPNQ